jgi:hypothetical protein
MKSKPLDNTDFTIEKKNNYIYILVSLKEIVLNFSFDRKTRKYLFTVVLF